TTQSGVVRQASTPACSPWTCTSRARIWVDEPTVTRWVSSDSRAYPCRVSYWLPVAVPARFVSSSGTPNRTASQLAMKDPKSASTAASSSVTSRSGSSTGNCVGTLITLGSSGGRCGWVKVGLGLGSASGLGSAPLSDSSVGVSWGSAVGDELASGSPVDSVSVPQPATSSIAATLSTVEPR